MTVREASSIVFLLPPFHANIGKELIKSPKIYCYDVGFATWLLGIEEKIQVASHPLRGNLFANMVVMKVVKYRYNQSNRQPLLLPGQQW